jgi:hypothetical protein
MANCNVLHKIPGHGIWSTQLVYFVGIL